MKFKSYHIANYIKVAAVLVIFVLTGIILCNSCSSPGSEFSKIIHPAGKEFAGSRTCKSCHSDIYESHARTAHALSSDIGSSQTIKGNFEPGSNDFILNHQLKVMMERNDSGFFQVGYIDGKEATRQSMDIVIGSGRKGQTYLFWYGNQLFQQPVSFYTPLNTWCNSPTFPDNQLVFSRVILPGCLECHSTYAKSAPGNGGIPEYDKSQMILGINCERCHGPAAEHVAFQQNNPKEKQAKFITNISGLTRQQKLDNCALCHSGIRQNSKPSFSFVTGDKLDDYSTPDYKADSAASLDVHGNQYGLLTASKCFKASTMDCSSCHNTHVKETDNFQLFSQRCMNCHSEAKHNFCKQMPVEGLVLKDNCIDCHMPALPSTQIFLNVQDKEKSTADLVRTHMIGIYRDEAKKYIQK